ncbi:hypothetical protein CA265_15745 [Sphingobacteriaceae bacterium GW460-11-11-14-LB5]|nr:hypothetical protein CA265_15745 [Sphingobacteriaceae bacterium GW460-11-11-14-LB5]
MTFILFYKESCAIFTFNRIFSKYQASRPNNPFTFLLNFIKNFSICDILCGQMKNQQTKKEDLKK